MVTFSCENCGDVLAKKKLDLHTKHCYGATFSCLDCGKNFQNGSWRAHTTCISEAQKTHGALYKEKDKKKSTTTTNSTASTAMASALVPRNAYVEDALDYESGAVAIVDAPPRAPSPPPTNINVFDFLMPDDASFRQSQHQAAKSLPSAKDSRAAYNTNEDNDAWYDVEEMPVDGDAMQREHASNRQNPYGYEYGTGPVPSGIERYNSFASRTGNDSRNSSFQTPAPTRNVSARGHAHKESNDSTAKKSSKRKRGQPEDIDLSAAKTPYGDVVMTDVPVSLSSGLTGGLSKLLSARGNNNYPFPPSPEISGEGEGIEESPLSPMKKQRQSAKEQRGADRSTRHERKAKPVLQRKAPTSHVKIGFAVQGSRRGSDTHSPSGSRESHRDRGESGERRRRRKKDRSYSPTAPEGHGRAVRAIEYKPRSVSPGADMTNAIVRRDPGVVALRPDMSAHARADLFMSFITKGPESERGCSINKALKRFHRERSGRKDDEDEDGDERGRRTSGGGHSESRKRRKEDHEKRVEERADDEKELWKSLRLKRNDRGEIVLFFDGQEG